MSQTTPPTVDTLPTTPNTSVPTGFALTMDTFLAALVTFRTQLVALGTNCFNNCVDAFNNAVAAAASASASSGYATAAANSASAAAVASGVSAWVSGTTYAIGDCRYSPANFWTYRRKTAGAGTTDPSSDTTNWALISSATPSFQLLATLTPTAAANVDFLSVFTAGYDNYLILGDGLLPSASDNLTMRLANAGSADTGSNYIVTPVGTSGGTPTTSITVIGNVYLSGKGAHFSALIQNINDTTNSKGVKLTASGQVSGTPTWSGGDASAYYANAAAVSGMRLYWAGGANFTATGKIRVYGFSNT